MELPTKCCRISFPCVSSGQIAADERTRLLAGTQRLEQHSQSIARSKRIAAECEDVGQDIMQNLGRQREGIERSINMVLPFPSCLRLCLAAGNRAEGWCSARIRCFFLQTRCTIGGMAGALLAYANHDMGCICCICSRLRTH